MQKKKLKLLNHYKIMRDKFMFLFTLCLLSNCKQIEFCKEFEYNRLGIDSSNYLTNKMFSNSTDTIEFKMVSFEINNLNEAKSGFSNKTNCDNGFFVDYECIEFDFYFTTWFLRNKKGYHYNLVSSQIKYVDDLYFDRLEQINAFFERDESFEGNKAKIKILKVETGELVSFIDQKNIEWRLVRPNL